MDLGFRQIFCSGNEIIIFVSILGLMDLGFRHKDEALIKQVIECFNPWFNGFRF